MNYQEKINCTLAELKDFQEATVSYAFRKLYEENTKRLLIADEVGLGKTIVARGLIARAFQKHLAEYGGKKNSFHVVYICSNAALASQNLKKLNILDDPDIIKESLERLVFLAYKKSEKENLKFKISSLTPGTSFQLTGGSGILKERDLIYSLLIRYKDFCRSRKQKNGLSYILQGGANYDRWLKTIEDNPQNNGTIHSKIFSEFKRRLKEEYLTARYYKKIIRIVNKDNISLWYALVWLSKYGASVRQYQSCFSELIGNLRRILTEISIQYLDADIFILDEFQRFKKMIDKEDQSEASILARKVFSIENAKVLMLSATPFKPYTNQFDEDNGESHYIEFEKVLKFLYGNPDSEFWKTYEQKRKSFYALLFKPQKALDDLENASKLKRELEDIYYSVMARTERMLVSTDKNSLIYADVNKKYRVSEKEIRNYLTTDKIIMKLNEKIKNKIYNPIEFCKSAPFPLSFLDRYMLYRHLQNHKEDPEIKRALKLNKSCWLNLSAIDNYEPILGQGGRSEYPNLKMETLLKETIENGGWRLLWIPPSLPYYEVTGAYLGMERFSKTIVFSAWIMVPKMIASLLSYEAERLSIGSRFSYNEKEKDEYRERKYFLTRQKSKRQPLPQFRFSFDKSGSLGNMSNFNILYPSITLAELYSPIDNLTGKKPLKQIKKDLKLRVTQLIDECKLRQYEIKIGHSDRRWYWAAAILLDKLNPHTKDSVTEFFSDRKFSLDLAVDTESDDVKQQKEDTSARNHHIDELKALYANPESAQLGKIPYDIADVLTEQILGSPAICAFRSLANYFSCKSSSQPPKDFPYNQKR